MNKIYKGMPNAAEKINENFQNHQSLLDGVIDSGSSENGNWIRFYDGTQICYLVRSERVNADTSSSAGSGIYQQASSTTWTYPKEFTEVPFASVDTIYRNAWGTLGGTPGTDSMTWGVLSTSPLKNNDQTVVRFAVGRWK